jgi:hypothetical protein
VAWLVLELGIEDALCGFHGAAMIAAPGAAAVSDSGARVTAETAQHERIC